MEAMNRWLVGALVVLIVAAGLSGCFTSQLGSVPEAVNGSGSVVSEMRDVGSFHGVELNAIGKLTISQGSEDRLTITADDNLLPLIKTTVRNGVLVIEFERPALTVNSVTNLEYDITVRQLDSVVMNGAGDARVVNLAGEKLRVKLAGAGNIVAAGKVTEQEVVLTGAGRYDAENLESEKASIAINGAGGATIWVTKSLDATINGMGSVSYYGDPQVTQHITGLGKVEPKGSK